MKFLQKFQKFRMWVNAHPRVFNLLQIYVFMHVMGASIAVLLGPHMLERELFDPHFGILLAVGMGAQFVASLTLSPILKRVSDRTLVRTMLMVGFITHVVLVIAIISDGIVLYYSFKAIEPFTGVFIATTTGLMLRIQFGDHHRVAMARMTFISAFTSSFLMGGTIITTWFLSNFGSIVFWAWVNVAISGYMLVLSKHIDSVISEEDKAQKKMSFRGLFRAPTLPLWLGILPGTVAVYVFDHLLPTSSLIFTYAAMALIVKSLLGSTVAIWLTQWLETRRAASPALILILRIFLVVGLSLMLVAAAPSSPLSWGGFLLGLLLWTVGSSQHTLVSNAAHDQSTQTVDKVLNGTLSSIQLNLSGIVGALYIFVTTSTIGVGTSPNQAITWLLVPLSLSVVLAMIPRIWRLHKLAPTEGAKHSVLARLPSKIKEFLLGLVLLWMINR